MAVSITNLTSGNDVDGNSTATTASITLHANKPALAIVSSRQAAADPNHATISGWTEVLSINYDNTGSQKRLTVLRRMVTSDSTAALTIDFASQSQSDVAWVIDEFTGADITGTNGSGMIVQTASNQDRGGTATTLTATLAAFSSANNATYGAIAVGNTSVTVTPGSGFTKIADGQANANGVHVTSEFRNDNDTTVDFTSNVGAELGVIAIEIKVSGATVFTSSLTGALSFTGTAGPTRTSKTLTGALSFVGAITRSVTHGLTATLSFVGAITKTASRALAGVLSFTGAFVKLPNKALNATLSFSGASSRAITHLLASMLSFTGVENMFTPRSFTGVLSFTGTVVKQTNKSFTGVVGFVGAIAKMINHTMTAALSFVGNITKTITHGLTGALGFAGAFAAVLVNPNTTVGPTIIFLLDGRMAIRVSNGVYLPI